MKLPIDKAHWKENVDLGGGVYNRSAVADEKRGLALWLVDVGVLVVQVGNPDRLVPMSNVTAVESRAGFGDELPASFGVTAGAGDGQAAPLTAAIPPSEKRGPGRPRKA